MENAANGAAGVFTAIPVVKPVYHSDEHVSLPMRHHALLFGVFQTLFFSVNRMALEADPRGFVQQIAVLDKQALFGSWSGMCLEVVA